MGRGVCIRLNAMESSNNYKVLLTMVVGFLLLYELTDFMPLFYLSLSLGLIGLISSKFAGIIVWLWTKIAIILGWVNSRILLSFIFFFILSPFSVFYRLTTQNPLGLRKKGMSSYHERNHSFTNSDMENSW